jgi:hypothetical protein
MEKMKVYCGKTHKYLGVLLDFSHTNQCRVTIVDYLDKIVVAYDKALSKLSDWLSAVKKKKNVSRTSAASDDLFCYNLYYGTRDMCTKTRYKDQCMQGT